MVAGVAVVVRHTLTAGRVGATLRRGGNVSLGRSGGRIIVSSCIWVEAVAAVAALHARVWPWASLPKYDGVLKRGQLTARAVRAVVDRDRSLDHQPVQPLALGGTER